jgi:hypothetical protein
MKSAASLIARVEEAIVCVSGSACSSSRLHLGVCDLGGSAMMTSGKAPNKALPDWRRSTKLERNCRARTLTCGHGWASERRGPNSGPALSIHT